MKDQNNLNGNYESQIIDNEDIDISLIFNKIFRNKLIILFIASASTALSVLVSNFQKPIYKGSFQIVIRDENSTNNQSANSLVNLVTGKNDNDSKTQEYILKSPLVLKPVFDFTKKEYIKRNNAAKSLSYKSWLKNSLDIEFEDGTQVLDISFKDESKELIIDTLNLIKNKYQAYSKRDRENKLKNAINFLESQQKILEEKSTNSLLALNKFSIKNGLGDIDGFVSLGKENDQINENANLLNIKIPSSTNFGSKQNAGQRFKNQFSLLEQYEAKYADNSAKLKPNSKYLSELKIKIDNLRSSLKRPNEILIKYRNLVKISERDENLLSNVENELLKTKLEFRRQLNPWELISNPRVDDKQVSPKVFGSAIQVFIISTFFGIIYAFYKEKKSGIIFEIKALKELVNCEFLDTIFSKNKILSTQIIDTYILRSFGDLKKSKGSNTSVVLTGKSLSNSDFSLDSKINNYSIIDLKDEKIIRNSDNLIFILTTNDVTYTDIKRLNTYVNIYREKIIGWFYLDSNTIL